MKAAVLALALLLTAPLAVALPTPGFNGAASLAVLGRVFPEALETNDYVSYDEARAGLEIIDRMAPDLVEIKVLGPSLGWKDPLGGGRDARDIFAVEVTNEKSTVPEARKLTLVFFLSIHGNEKGGREGGLRVIEDLARGIGLAEEEPELVPMLDYQRLVFLFANSDGWTREEGTNRIDAMDPQDPLQTVAPSFARENANFTDLNRQFPTSGYLFEEYTPMSEPEPRAMVEYTKSLPNVVAGADVHGMLQNTNLVRLLLKDGQKTQQLLFENERLAELYKERLNANPAYDAWASGPDARGVCCGQVAEWAATFDAIGYSASGTAGAWIVQRQGLDAPGYTVEFAYNHLVTDNYYPGAGAQFNAWHVEAMRDITSVFMRFASEKVMLSVETQGHKVAVLSTPFVATSADDDKAKYAGWFAETDVDDAFDIANKGFTASPQGYWRDLAAFARDGERPGVLDSFDAWDAIDLDAYDTIVVPGSAVSRLPKDLGALRAWVEKGGNLVLTDAALQALAPLGVVETDAVGNKSAYSGYMDIVDREHPLVADLKGYPRQTYDPNPLGFAPDTSPVWFVDREAWEAAGGVTVGAVSREGTGEAVVESPEQCDSSLPRLPLWMQRPDPEHFGEAHDLAEALVPRTVTAPILVLPKAANLEFGRGNDCAELDGTDLGVLALGAGKVHVFGAILPDATEESNHPYGLDDHAVAANGNHVLLNVLGFSFAFTTPPAVEALGLTGEAAAETVDTAGVAPQGVPGLTVLSILATLAGLVLLSRRR